VLHGAHEQTALRMRIEAAVAARDLAQLSSVLADAAKAKVPAGDL
jgi:hypothetical protein